MDEEIHVSDTGTRFTVTMKDRKSDGTELVLPIGGATRLDMIFQAPSGKFRVQQGTLLTDGSDGKMFYDIRYGSELQEAAFEPGQHPLWKLQGEVDIGSGSWRSSIPDFEVHPNIGPPRALAFKPDTASASALAPAVTLIGP